MQHLEFSRVKIGDKQRRKKPGFGIIPCKDHIFHGKYIKDSIDENIKSTVEKSSQFKFNPYLVLKVELEDDVIFTEKEEENLELFGLKIIDKETNQLQVLFSDDINIKIFKEELDSYKQGKIAITKVKNNDLFCKIKSISEWSREDRIALNLDQVKKGSYVDVYLWVFDTKELSKSKMDEFSRYASNINARICDTYVGESVVIARVKVDEVSIENILHHPLVYKVEDITKINILQKNVQDIKSVNIDDLEFSVDKLNPDTSTSICVIDSGIYQQHPLFNGVIGDSKTFYLTNEFEDVSDDLCGHGTKVASICEYGDFNHTDKFVPEIFLHNAKIHNGQYESIDTLWKLEVEKQIGEFSSENIDNFIRYQDGEYSLDEFIETFPKNKQPYLKMVYSKYSSMYEKLIPTQMVEIVNYFYTIYGCRIYNLSQGDGNSIYSGNKPKAWACVLDELQQKLDIIFIVSSGNYYYEEHSDYSEIENDYPHYMFRREQCKIIEPANSVNSITVGSIAISENTYVSIEKVNKRSISKKNQISTITRIGPGVLSSIKPDFVAYGGDRGIEIDFLGRMKATNDIGLSKLLFNNDRNGLFAWDRGTSFAAPYVAHLAAKILNKYPNCSNNLIRAILASSSVISNEVTEIIEKATNGVEGIRNEFKYRGDNNIGKMLHYVSGYGFPQLNRCLESLDNRVVLMADIKEDADLLKVDDMHVYQVPLPEEFRKSTGKKKVIVSLAFNPKVRNTRLDYIGVSMDYKLIKGKSREDVISIYESQAKKDEKAKKENKYECKAVPGPDLRSRGTLQKSEFIFTMDKNFNDEDLYLVVNAIKEWDYTPQKYAVVVVLESEDEKLKLYNIVKNRVEERIRSKA